MPRVASALSWSHPSMAESAPWPPARECPCVPRSVRLPRSVQPGLPPAPPVGRRRPVLGVFSMVAIGQRTYSFVRGHPMRSCQMPSWAEPGGLLCLIQGSRSPWRREAGPRGRVQAPWEAVGAACLAPGQRLPGRLQPRDPPPTPQGPHGAPHAVERVCPLPPAHFGDSGSQAFTCV